MIKMIDICKNYQMEELRIPVLHNINLEIMPGEFVAIMGPSGSGKSTLLNLLGLLDMPSRGEYFLDGININRLTHDDLARIRNQMIGFIFQSYMLLPQMTLLENVALPLTYHSMPRIQKRDRSYEMLFKVGLEQLAHKKPFEISGGQQQRVAIARALVMNPKLILADEPTGALDSATGQDILNLLKHFNSSQNTTVLIITHDLHIGKQCKRMITLQDGKIIRSVYKLAD
jgi:putative ABC transport system ATP-binding protein